MKNFPKHLFPIAWTIKSCSAVGPPGPLVMLITDGSVYFRESWLGSQDSTINYGLTPTKNSSNRMFPIACSIKSYQVSYGTAEPPEPLVRLVMDRSVKFIGNISPDRQATP